MKKAVAALAIAIGLASGAIGGTLDIGGIQCGYVLTSGWVVTGTLKDPYRIAIQDGATVTISNMVVNLDADNLAYLPGLTCNGNATLILKGTNTIKSIRAACPGISVPPNKTLTIKGDGLLTAIGKDLAAAIGGGTNAPCGNIVIESGAIEATGGARAAGIGSGYKSSCGNITIKDGAVTATGGGYGAAIGGGWSGSCGCITIDGGKVVANGTSCAPGIGSGDDGSSKLGNSCGDVAINGGIVYATGGINAPGIGNGRAAACGDISIGPGIIMVKATAGENAQPIGRASSGTCGTVTVDKSLRSTVNGKTRTIRSNIIDLSTVEEDMTIYSGSMLTGELVAKRKLSIAPESVVTLSNAVINGVSSANLRSHQWAGLNCLGNVQLVLVGENTVRGFDAGFPGIHIVTNSALYMLGSGSLAASSNGNAAGIGGGVGLPCGVITIQSGYIEAVGSSAAGIGGYSDCDGVYIFGGSVYAQGGTGSPGIGGGPCYVGIRGGDVIAYGGKHAAGIGGGYMDNYGCEILIMGGNVNAYGGKYGAGIGSGGEGVCGQIQISGGNVIAVGGAGASGIGFGKYGICGQVGIANAYGVAYVSATCGEGGTPITAGRYDSPEAPILKDGFYDDDGYPTRTIWPLEEWELTIGGGKDSMFRNYSCEAKVGESFSVACNGSWTATASASWITVDAGLYGGGNGMVSYSLAENTGTSKREGTITVKCGHATCACTITQDKPLLIGGKTSMSRTYDAAKQAGCYFSVTCSQSPWTAVSSASWVTLKSGSKSGTGSGKVYYDVAANTSASQRTATIKVTSRSLTRTCTITQKAGAEPTLTIGGGKTSMSRAYSCEAKSGEPFSVACNGSWTAIASASWITITSGVSGSGNGKVTYSLTENTGTSKREGTIKVKCGGITRTCTITQDKPLLIGGKTEMSRTYEASKQTDCYFSVTCSQSAWTAVSSASWVTLKSGSASGTGSGKVYYDVAANTSTSQRTATIKVTSRGLTRTCTIKQKGK